MKADVDFLREEFFTKYGDRANDPVIFYSPGRVNLIGEHTDYNDGFVANTQQDFEGSKWYVLDMTESLKVFRKQEMVQKQDDILELINPFIKKKQRDTLEMVERITYLYQDFRDKAVELVTPVMDNVIAECIRLLTEKSSQEDRIYVLHLDELIGKHEAEKEELTNQLTEDEKELQLDNDWFLQFENQVNKIGRG